MRTAVSAPFSRPPRWRGTEGDLGGSGPPSQPKSSQKPSRRWGVLSSPVTVDITECRLLPLITCSSYIASVNCSWASHLRSYEHLSHCHGSVCTAVAICPVLDRCTIVLSAVHAQPVHACTVNVLSGVHVYSHLSC